MTSPTCRKCGRQLPVEAVFCPNCDSPITIKKIFLTGATGVMGSAGLHELTSSSENYDITVLARNSKKNHRKLKPFINKGVKVIWGDLLDHKSISRGVADADIVLHVGGMVSPQADWYPDKTVKVNVGAMQLIVDEAKRQQNIGHDVAVVYIGSVSQYGFRPEPVHWGEAGDPMRVATFDKYALSKVMAERILAESGLKRWVSLRQSGILHSGLLMNASDPISFHVPIRGVLEWATVEDSGRLLERVCRSEVPENFWCDFYNIGSGKSFRLMNYDFERMLMQALHCPSPEKVFESNWFATRNFHGIWYKDSDRLEKFLHFREGTTAEEYFRRMAKKLPWYFRLAPLAPAIIIKLAMKRVALNNQLGTLGWIKNNQTDRIAAAFGSRKEWEQIPNWEHTNLSQPSDNFKDIDYGYDTNNRPEDLNDDELETAAVHRGGHYIADIGEWECSEGHRFKASPHTILRGGHWCEKCLAKTSDSLQHESHLADHNPFLKQFTF